MKTYSTNKNSIGGCSCVIYNPANDSILLTKRQDVPVWTFPGGTREKGEDPKDCVIREINEELGLNIKNPTLFAQYILKSGKRKNFYGTFYTNEKIKIDPKEVSLYKWFSLSKTPKSIGFYNNQVVLDYKAYLTSKKVIVKNQKINLKKEILILLTTNPLNFLLVLSKYTINQFTKKTFKI